MLFSFETVREWNRPQRGANMKPESRQRPRTCRGNCFLCEFKAQIDWPMLEAHILEILIGIWDRSRVSKLFLSNLLVKSSVTKDTLQPFKCCKGKLGVLQKDNVCCGFRYEIRSGNAVGWSRALGLLVGDPSPLQLGLSSDSWMDFGQQSRTFASVSILIM